MPHCPPPTPRVHSNSCPSSQRCHPAILSSVVPFSSCPQSLPASQSFPLSQLFAWGGQSTGVSASASFLPKNTQDWSPLEWPGWSMRLVSLTLKGPHCFQIKLKSFKMVFKNLHDLVISVPHGYLSVSVTGSLSVTTRFIMYISFFTYVLRILDKFPTI